MMQCVDSIDLPNNSIFFSNFCFYSDSPTPYASRFEESKCELCVYISCSSLANSQVGDELPRLVGGCFADAEEIVLMLRGLGKIAVEAGGRMCG